ncbi:MAG: HD domain-containing phosphohydrolase [Candidatus Omnitrophota bacterium]
MDKELRILIVEDSAADAELVARELVKEGLAHVSKIVESRDGLLKALLEFAPDIVLCDYKMPAFTAPEVLKIVKEVSPKTPFIVVSGTIGEDVAVEMMKSGAADYVMKDKIFRLAPAVKRALKESSECAESMKTTEALLASERKMHRVLTETIEALSTTLEKRDPYTAGHQRRVAQLSVAIAKFMGRPENEINGLYLASLVHDIGKIGVPVEILVKPTKLNDDEMRLVRDHAKIGYDILKDIEFPWPIAQMVFQHHEKINGSGYPQGLAGEAILLESKILCVADTIEAMSSHRPYRSALGIDASLEELSCNKGIMYDPGAVDACIELFTKKSFRFE